MNNLNFLQKIKTFILSHKIWSLVIGVGIIIILYFVFKTKTTTETRYITGEVTKGNVITSVSGSGQIEASDTINLKTKTSGEINYIGVRAGETVSKGQLIASVDSRDAKLALENAKISLAKLTDSPDSLTLLQKQNSLDKLYIDSWNNTTSFIANMSSVITGLESLHNNYLGTQNKMLLSSSGKDKIDLSEKAYWDAKNSLDTMTKLYKSLSISSSKEDIQNLTKEALKTSKIISTAVKLAQASVDYTSNSLDKVNTTEVNTVQSNLNSWTTSVNNYLDSITSNINSIEENTLALKNFLVGSDELDIKSAELTVENKQAAYNDCFLYAPFNGVIATFTAKVGDSSGSTLGTLITKQKVATISLNEVDIAKIKLDQKVTITFDAIDGLSITGKVAEIDQVGTVSQGVVSYNVSISLDVDDSRIKPGMSVSAVIITDVVQDVLTVLNSSIKNQNGLSYVEIFDSPLATPVSGIQGSVSNSLPKQVQISTGLVGDTSTEITSGIKEGDIIVTKTITATAAKTTTAPSILGAVGGNKSTGGSMRAVTGH